MVLWFSASMASVVSEVLALLVLLPVLVLMLVLVLVLVLVVCIIVVVAVVVEQDTSICKILQGLGMSSEP